ncbi:FAD-dependent oxidoreductase [Chlorobaculum sp. MV4-Y]|uniref:NAD(P)/FAD-dependent oxidoreductase n=1 Tax=Chlorobaculum sp. MV4-Y TaxID=2976335 RepID=UPI0021AEB193|nr:FAD-dependent oxidoreductase [Chlorobaculum sp. MV4-Y]UWX58547.1 FAD-dependent oxidoreductase [Chlorobaculum sp. MV4-Y]
MKKVLILGGGIAGVAAAIAFRKRGFEVEVVSDREFVFIYPIAIWIPVGTEKFKNVAFPLEKLARKRGFALTLDKVTAIDASRDSVTLEKAGVRSDFDFLVIALGLDKMKHEGIEYTLSICGAPEHSIRLKEKIDALVERGHGKIAFGFGDNPKDPSGVRGGPGFELFFNLHHKLTKLGIRDNFEMTFFAPMAQPGAKMGQKALDMMAVMFKAKSFKQRYGKKITRFEPDGVVFEDGSKLESDLTMFIPAGSGHSVFKNSDLPLSEAGFVKIDDFCRVVGVDSWYAVGDSAALEGPEWKAKQGHIAEFMAECAANNCLAEHFGHQEPMKGYQEHLNVLCVMDTGDGAGFVYRTGHSEMFIPMPIVGHWLKKAWGYYYKLSKMKYIPRIPVM